MKLTFEQLPFLYQLETVECANWVGANLDNYKREALRIWEEEKYESGNINATQRRNEVVMLFERLLRYKRNWQFNNVDQAYRNARGGARVHNVSQKQFETWNQKNQLLQTQLDQLQQQVGQQQQTINSLNQQNQTLQSQLNELNDIINGVPLGAETEARIVQSTTDLPPK